MFYHRDNLLGLLLFFDVVGPQSDIYFTVKRADIRDMESERMLPRRCEGQAGPGRVGLQLRGNLKHQLLH